MHVTMVLAPLFDYVTQEKGVSRKKQVPGEGRHVAHDSHLVLHQFKVQVCARARAKRSKRVI